jgi:ubiquinone/menaquinone biosynthesis C-methylase UbiE
MGEQSGSNVKKLHLGCGRTIKNGWINLDIMPLPGVNVIADLDACKTVPLPFEDSSIDEFFSSHLLQHLHNTLDFMQELYRVAKPDAKAVFRVPYGSTDAAFEDPTHVRQYFLSSFGYFSQPFYWAADYGYRGDWSTEKIDLMVSAEKFRGKAANQIFYDINTYRNIVLEMVVTLLAVKPIREPKRELMTAPEITIVLV